MFYFFLLNWHFSYVCVFKLLLCTSLKLTIVCFKVYYIIVWSIWKSYNNMLVYHPPTLSVYLYSFFFFSIYSLLFLVSFIFHSKSGLYGVIFFHLSKSFGNFKKSISLRKQNYQYLNIWKYLILLLLKDIFSEDRIVDWKSFSFNTWRLFFYYDTSWPHCF